jgi:tetratricopeptide (TPR) repeat protein
MPNSARVVLSVCLVACAALVTPGAALAQDPLELVKEGRKLEQAGKLEEGLALYRKAVAADPKLFDAQLALGRALDLAGDLTGGRKALQDALSVATDANRNAALSAIAVSYAFESRPAEAEKPYRQIFDGQLAAGRYEDAGATANAIARIYLEAGDAGNAEKWYRTGYDTAKKAANPTPAQTDVLEWRWQNAQGRIAARRGQIDAARAFAAKGKAVLDNGTIPDQTAYYPYLVGYIEFYAKNYPKAIEELLKGDLRDVFVLGLLGQAYDMTGDPAKAREYFTKVMASASHSINAAYSRPQARKYLAGARPR